ncbi:hypothetical protein KY290_003076 [Solanum tuberosum]|uniref:GH10 domain-containing protein n=1 Tax=Solanum tuberosum TaxID=4113 RepID=A0ABQ7WTY0_SOLTU|nr:hypothetical protein KY285_003044 [Solanum tuberosum]KAH0783478.1 hypothetical protein KY290_003076 [Solanum tuberosum]
MFKGGLVVNASGPAQLYFETNNADIDIWVDSISVQSFSQEEWTSHQTQTIEKVRKSKVAIQVVDSQGKALPNATISLFQGRANFPFGVAMNKNILNNNAYQNWFISRFKYTVFEDEMKWYSTENSQGKVDYSTSDAMVNLCKSKGVSIRGQNVLWDDQKFQPNWVPALSPQQLSVAAGKRVASVVTKYRGQLLHWDVMNENLHFKFFESKLGANASATFYRLASQFDNKTPLFLNEYNTIEVPSDGQSSPANYLNMIKQLRTGGYAGPLGIGLEGHFGAPTIAYIRAGLDTLASAKLPMWITELDVRPDQNQAQVLDQVIKEIVGHPAVQGLIIWSAWKPTGCFRMCLTDNNFKNLPTGDVVDKARATLSHEGLIGTTNAEGYFETSLFHGDYKAIVTHPSMADSSFHHNLTCLKNPLKPQYNGGIVTNPEFNDGLNGWAVLGVAKIENNVSSDGNKFIVASERKEPYHGFSQEFQLDKDKLYAVSGWVQVNHGDDATIAVIFKTQGGFQHAAWANAKSGCWSMFKGGLVVNASGPAQLYFETNNTAVDIWIDNISVQPFSQEEWTSHQTQTIEKVRKSKVAIQVVDSQGKPLPNATISLIQGRANFPFGCAINKNILNNNAYQNWFFSRFKYTVFEDEMKWYSTENSQGKVDYSTSDAMVNLCKSKGVSIRGHNILWDDPKFQPNWVPSLSPQQLSVAAGRRVGSVVAKYRGQVIHWDVVNENLHFNFFESKLGASASATFYRLAAQFDNRTPLFLNEFNTIEDQRDGASSPANYLNKIRQIRAGGYRGSLGIGLEGHFVTPNQAYIRSAIDTLASAKLPIWITELDVQSSPNQAQFLDQIIKEVVGHPAVQGLLIWSAWTPNGCYKMCLTDNNFKNLATGDVVDKIRVSLTHEDLVGTTNGEGYFETSLFHGDYKAIVTHPTMVVSSFHHNLTVMPTTSESSSERVFSYKFMAA